MILKKIDCGKDQSSLFGPSSTVAAWLSCGSVLDPELGPKSEPCRTSKREAVQGLSDFRTAVLPAVGDIVDDRCYLYVVRKDASVPAGAC